jgi:hypothetical protein
MTTITNYTELKQAIQLIEAEQKAKGQELKEQFFLTFASLNPLSLSQGHGNGLFGSSSFVENILVNILGMATGFLSKKAVVGSSHNIFRNIIGSVVQAGTTGVIIKNADTVKTIGQFFLKYLLRKREAKSQQQ